MAFAAMLYSITAHSQISPGVVSNFGVDGDPYSGERLLGTFNPDSTDDWFYKSNPFPGRGIIDTTGAAALRTLIETGSNSFLQNRFLLMVQKQILKMTNHIKKYSDFNP